MSAAITAEERAGWRRLRNVGLIGADADRLCDALDAADAMAEALDSAVDSYVLNAEAAYLTGAHDDPATKLNFDARMRHAETLYNALATYRQHVQPPTAQEDR